MYYAFTLFKDFHVLISADGSEHQSFSPVFGVFPQKSPKEIFESSKIRVPYMRSSADVLMDFATMIQDSEGDDVSGFLSRYVEILHLPISLDERCRSLWPVGFHPCSPEPGHLSRTDYEYVKPRIEDLDGSHGAAWRSFSSRIESIRLKFVNLITKAARKRGDFAHACHLLSRAISEGKFNSEFAQLLNIFEGLQGTWEPLSESTLYSAFLVGGFFYDVYVEDLTRIRTDYEHAKREREPAEGALAAASAMRNMLQSPKGMPGAYHRVFEETKAKFQGRFQPFFDCLEELGISQSSATIFAAVLSGGKCWEDPDEYQSFSKLLVPCAWIGDSPFWAHYLQDFTFDKETLDVKLVRVDHPIPMLPREVAFTVIGQRVTTDATPVSLFLICCADILHRMGHQFDPAVGSVFVKSECLAYANCLCGSARQSNRLASIIYLIFEAWRSCEIPKYKPVLDSILDPELRGLIGRVLA